MLEVSGVALSLTGPNGHHLLVTSSNPLAARIAELEFSLGEGPGTQARSTGGPVLVNDLRSTHSSSRWPAYAAAVGDTPVRSQCSYPLQIGVITLGMLTLYREATRPFTEEEAAHALVLADAATVLLLHLQDVSEGDGELHLEMAAAFVETAELHQATGMVSVQAAVGMKEALLLLYARAYSTGSTSLEVAQDVLVGRINFRREWGHDEQ
jgi:GAF domain-containing protein